MTAGLRARPAPTRTPAAQGHWRVILQLTLVESRRLLRHPVTLLATVCSTYLLWRASGRYFPVLHSADADATVSLAPLALATLLATNLAASRAHRHRSQELYEATATPPWHRTCAHLLSGGAAALLALLLAAADMLWLASQEGAVGTPNPFELLTGPAIVWGAGALGVLAGVWAPSPVTGPLLVVMLTAVQYIVWWSQSWASSWFAPVVPADTPVPAGLMLRPARWHLLYVLGLGALLAGLALARRGPRVPVAALLAVGLAAATSGAVLIRPVPADLGALRSALQAPESVQTCQQNGTVTMCAFAGFERWIPHWEEAAVGMLDRLPLEADPEPVTVRQFMPSWGWGTRGELDPAPVDRWPARPPREGEVPLHMDWGAPGDRLGLATDVAIVALGLQGVQPSTDLIPPVTGTRYCQAPAIVAMWLSAQSDPDAETVMRAKLENEYASVAGQVPVPAVALTSWRVFSDDSPVWGRREVQYALQLLERPDAEVRDVLERDWAVLTAPDTTRAEAAERLGLEPLPAYRQELLEHGVPSGQLDAVAEETGIPLDDTDAEATC